MDQKLDKDFLVDKITLDSGYLIRNDLQAFVCEICKCIVENPAIMTCEHIACLACIKQTKKCNLCPRVPIPYPYTENRALKNLLNKKKISCLYSDRGCKVACSWLDLKTHSIVCGFRMVECPLCQDEMFQSSFPMHQITCDPILICILCENKIDRKDAKKHIFRLPLLRQQQLCPGVQKCPNDCLVAREISDGKKKEMVYGVIPIGMGDSFNHLQIECANLLIHCPYCGTQIRKSKWKSHLVETWHSAEINRKHLEGLYRDLYEQPTTT